MADPQAEQLLRVHRDVLALLCESADDDPAVVERLLATVGGELGCRSSALWMRAGEDIAVLARWPRDADDANRSSEPIPSYARTRAATPVTCEDGTAAWFPVVSGDAWLGGLELCRHEPFVLEAMTLDALRAVARALGHHLTRVRGVRALAAEHHRALAASEAQLRALARRLLDVREQKRAKLAREVHDVLGQELTCLKLDAAWLLRRFDDPAGAEPERMCDRLRFMIGSIDRMTDTVRRIATDLRPRILDDLGLVPALQWLRGEVSARSGLEITLVAPEQLDLGRDLATAVFRMVQELLTNVVRHAKARAVEIRLECADGELVLRVRDDGIGIASGTTSLSSSLGLAGIRERAMPFGGTFAIAPRAGRGTDAIIRIPVSGGEP